ncbi:MAG: hypothetical protein GY820_28070 [Gammaproteobacteria bacterium]|nr:hypothetical protein [Gammaproteobacteria bacterium]
MKTLKRPAPDQGLSKKVRGSRPKTVTSYNTDSQIIVNRGRVANSMLIEKLTGYNHLMRQKEKYEEVEGVYHQEKKELRG